METLTPTIDARSLVLATPVESPTTKLQRVFEAVCDGLYRFILIRVSLDRDAADEILQQVCHEAARHRRIPTIDSECEAWLRGIARNLLRKHWRLKRRSKQFVSIDDVRMARGLAEDMDARPLPPDVLAKKEVIQALLVAVTSLSQAEQELVFGFYFDGLSQTEIAAQCSMSVKSVESKLYRVRSRLRTILRHIEKE